MKTLIVDLTEDEITEVRNALTHRMENDARKSDLLRATLGSARAKIIKAATLPPPFQAVEHRGKVA